MNYLDYRTMPFAVLKSIYFHWAIERYHANDCPDNPDRDFVNTKYDEVSKIYHERNVYAANIPAKIQPVTFGGSDIYERIVWPRDGHGVVFVQHMDPEHDI